VYCFNFNDLHRKNIQKLGVGHKIFCRKKHYSFNGNAILEKAFSKFENNYNKIVKHLINRSKVTIQIKSQISEWLLLTKMRNPYLRDNFSRNIKWVNEIMFKLKKEEYDHSSLEKFSKNHAKFLQLQQFMESDKLQAQFKDYQLNFGSKKWKILFSKNAVVA
jgi:hypothetical protein